MSRRTVVAVVVAAMLLTAGCASQVAPGDEGTEAGTGTHAGTDADADTDAEASTDTHADASTDAPANAKAGGTVSVYVSDEENAIDQFEHLNVTVAKVGLHRADDGNATDGGQGGWVEQDVEGRTVDLTNYLGANATRLTDVAAPNGSYDKVFVHVSQVDGTLKNGEQVRVKLPSSKLHIKTGFAVGDGEQVDFVYDITVFEAGKSGKFILKPVVSESGTSDQVDIEKPDEDEEAAERADDRTLNVSLDGPAVAGENVTVSVTRDGSAVANATVEANGDEVGATGADGTLVVSVPADAEELELEVERGEAEGDLTVAVDAADDAEDGTATPTATSAATSTPTATPTDA